MTLGEYPKATYMTDPGTQYTAAFIVALMFSLSSTVIPYHDAIKVLHLLAVLL